MNIEKKRHLYLLTKPQKESCKKILQFYLFSLIANILKGPVVFSALSYGPLNKIDN